MKKNIWSYLKADPIFRDHIPFIKNYKNKIRGKDGRGNKIKFSPEEKLLIEQQVKLLIPELLYEFKKEHPKKNKSKIKK